MWVGLGPGVEVTRFHDPAGHRGGRRFHVATFLLQRRCRPWSFGDPENLYPRSINGDHPTSWEGECHVKDFGQDTPGLPNPALPPGSNPGTTRLPLKPWAPNETSGALWFRIHLQCTSCKPSHQPRKRVHSAHSKKIHLIPIGGASFQAALSEGAAEEMGNSGSPARIAHSRMQ